MLDLLKLELRRLMCSFYAVAAFISHTRISPQRSGFLVCYCINVDHEVR